MLRVGHHYEWAVGGFPAVRRGCREDLMVNGVHDLGGMDCLGSVIVQENEPVFRAEWEKMAFATFASYFRAGLFGVDEFRLGIEKMHPAEYLLSNYYEHWIATAEYSAVKDVVLSPENV